MIDCNYFGKISLCKKYCDNYKDCTIYLDFPKKLKKLLEKENCLINEVIDKSKELEQIQKRKELIIIELRIKKEKEMGIK